MAEDNEEKLPYQLLTCPECQGSGLAYDKLCHLCGGLKIAAWTGQEFYYFGKKLERQEIAGDKIRQDIKVLINLCLMALGILGLLSFAWLIYSLVDQHLPFWGFYRIHDDWRLPFFWLTLLSDCYLFFRLQLEKQTIGQIPRRKNDAMAPSLSEISWSLISALPKNKKIDISGYFTHEALLAIEKSVDAAHKYDSHEVKPVHLLISLLTFENTQIVFSRIGTSFSTLKSRLAGVLAKHEPRSDEEVTIGLQIQEAIFQAYFLAVELRLNRVGLTELLQAIASQENEVKELLYDLNVTQDKIINVIAWLRINQQLRENWRRFQHKAILRPKSAMNRSMTAIATPVLDAFSQDLTLLAKFGYLVPCVGRQKEFDEIFSILAGGPRRSLILIGNPGVGKNTIIEGLAQMMVEENVPDFLRDKRLVSLSIAKLVSGTDASGAQDRMMRIITEIRRSGNIVLFIGDIANMVGITAGREGSIDLADVLSQALSKNNILCLATTTAPEYKKYIEEKSSLDRVLEKIMVAEVSGNEAIQILESKANTIEYHHQVFFSYDAVEAAVKLADRYLHDRYLPEKAVQIMEEVATRVKDKKGKNSLITGNDVAQVISEKTNIPLTEITKEESEKLLNLEEKIHERMIDQEEAVSMVATSLRRARAEMRDIKRPIVNLLFLGPTGVGKTELAKTVAAVYFGDEKNMIRLDMSEYQEQSSLSRLIGAPPGFSGSDTGGYLTEAVRKNPFSLVLLDEIEKAHPDILNVFLQVLDDGRLTDSSGRTIDFTNTIIIATSNAGTKVIQDSVRQGVPLEEIKKQLMERDLGQYFRPEFLNRFDGIIIFKPLALPDVEEIAKLLLNKIGKDLEVKGISLEVTPQGLSYIAQAGFDPEFGARPLKRVIQQKVQDQLANFILQGSLGRRDTVKLEADGKIEVIKAKQL